MYALDNECCPTTLAGVALRDNPTVLENIDRKIKYHQTEIARLEAAKVTMAPLLSMKLGDMREIMSY